MDYEQKYKSALAWMQSLYPGLHGNTREEAEKYFPELAESEDERIRKELIHYFSDGVEFLSLCSFSREDILVWLEKQNNEKLEEQLDKMIEADLSWLEKQGENHADKVEPKFKVGNWYQCIKDFFGKGITFDKDTAYYCAKEGCLQDKYGCHIAIVKDLYDNFKLWTIDDAKDGDVLVRNECIFIFKKITDNDWISTYYVLYCDGELFEHEDRLFTKDRGADGRTHPATKEQRDTLMKAMADAGYAFENKEKYCQKPIEWSLPYEKNKTAEKLIALAECLEADGDCLFNGLSGNDYGKFLRVLAKELTKVEPAEWSEEDKQYFNFLKKLLENLQVKSTENEIKKGTTNNSEYYYKVIQWLNSIKDRIQPKQEWKQENTDDLTDFENAMMHIGGSFFGQHAGLDPNDANAIKKQANLLLELVPKQEWSEEDKIRLDRICKTLWKNRRGDTDEIYQQEQDVDWLKSLRPYKR